jgi:ATP-binding cassette subfamily A (ABC1) protein 3
MSATFIIGFFLVFITDRFQSVEQLIEWIKKPRKPDVEMGSIGRNGKSALLDHDELLVANNLSKEFNTSKCCGKTLKHEIINNVSFKVPKGKCYGMIGPNGVGKTTTMEILTANLLQTSGQCYIKTSNDEKIDSIRDRYLYRQQIGYCPQIDAIAKYMTAKEMLNYMMMIKGYSCEKIKSEVDMWLNKTAIKDFEDVVSKNYSGGTKRKLNIAMGMVSETLTIQLNSIVILLLFRLVIQRLYALTSRLPASTHFHVS